MRPVELRVKRDGGRLTPQEDEVKTNPNFECADSRLRTMGTESGAVEYPSDQEQPESSNLFNNREVRDRRRLACALYRKR